jgi:SAM-dependent methyltransferase
MDRAFEPFGASAQAALALHEGERVLDVGCGCGSATLSLALAVGERRAVTGIDVSGPMLDRAADAQNVRASPPGSAGCGRMRRRLHSSEARTTQSTLASA